MDKRDKSLRYEGLDLPEKMDYILEQDFWMLDNVNPSAFSLMDTPIKFTSTTSIYVKRGHCRAEINLQEQEITAPCIVTITASQIMEPLEMSEDFEAAFLVMSDNLISQLLSMINDEGLVSRFRNHPVFQIPAQHIQDFEVFFRTLTTIVNDKGNKYQYKAVLYSIVSFFYTVIIKCNEAKKVATTTSGHITESFLKLIQENFKKERFLDFYAEKLQITTKHLSRTIKAETGYTAGEWLERLIVLEAKVLLKSSNMNIQQIAEELNFPTQSFFGKYFKNKVGMSPKSFRNS